MPEDLILDLDKYKLADPEHASGCPAKPERQEAFVTRKPAERGLVQRGTDDAGKPVFVEGQVPGEQVVIARCCDCGNQRLFEVGELDG